MVKGPAEAAQDPTSNGTVHKFANGSQGPQLRRCLPLLACSGLLPGCTDSRLLL